MENYRAASKKRTAQGYLQRGTLLDTGGVWTRERPKQVVKGGTTVNAGILLGLKGDLHDSLIGRRVKNAVEPPPTKKRTFCVRTNLGVSLLNGGGGRGWKAEKEKVGKKGGTSGP